MKITTLALATALAATLGAQPAMAQSDAPDTSETRFVASFAIPAGGTTESVYKAIKRQSHVSCRKQLRQVRTFSARLDYMRSCKAELVDQAVDHINRVDLNQYHAQATGTTAPRQMASLDR